MKFIAGRKRVNDTVFQVQTICVDHSLTTGSIQLYSITVNITAYTPKTTQNTINRYPIFIKYIEMLVAIYCYSSITINIM
jgi:hypothetical protein